MEEKEKEKEKKPEQKNAKPIEKITLITTVATLILVFCTIFQLHRTTASMKADFAHKIKIDFFNEDERTLMFLFDNNLLEFKMYKDSSLKIVCAYFLLNKERARYFQNDSINLLGNVKSSYSTLEVEDLLLNNFEDLNMYRINKLIGSDYLDDGFSAYIESIYKNAQIQKLIKWLVSEEGENDSYSGFKDIYTFLKNYENKKHKVP